MIPDTEKLNELRTIAEKFGTPSYVYDARVIESRISAIRSAFENVPLRLLYAMKANALPELLRVMKELNLGVDVVSPGEMHLAIRMGFHADSILFSANNMTDEEMATARSNDVLINIGELTRLEKYGRRFPGSELSIRINPQFGAGHHEHVVTAGENSKFGIPVADLRRARDIAHAHDLTISGLHQHIGSGNLEIEPYEKAIEVLFSVARDFPDARYLNIGGGIGVAYRPEERSFDLASLASIIEAQLDRFRTDTDGRVIEIWMEPGRFLSAESGILLIEANTVKESFGKVFVGTNSGMSHLIRPAIYGAYHGVVNVTRPNGPEHMYNVVGNICESSDFFAHDRSVAEIREGDVLAVLDAGAYGMAMASEYNLRPLPREVMVDNSGRVSIARDSETPAELVERILNRS